MLKPRLEAWARSGGSAAVAVVGAGFVGRGLVWMLERTPGVVPALVVNRTVERGLGIYRDAGVDPAVVLVSDDPDALAQAVADGRRAVTTAADVLPEITGIDVVVEATGALEHGSRVVLAALDGGRDVVSMNAELDATLGYLLHERARRSGAIYTIADGDQPGVLLRQLDFVAGMGLEIVAAVNCKRNLDVHQSPDDSRPYAERDNTSVLMTTAFGDGTKMQIENAVVANLTGLVPDRRGMHGVETTLEHVVEDVLRAISQPGVVEFTRGGDFGGGVLVIGRSDDPLVAPYMKYGKLGDGPAHLFFRPYHLLHFEVPWTLATVLLDRMPLAAPTAPPVAEVVAIAKRDLAPGERLDGIGGYCCYGHVDTVDRAEGLLPIGLAEHATVRAAVRADDAVPLEAVDLDGDAPLVHLRSEQDELVAARVRAALGGAADGDVAAVEIRRLERAPAVDDERRGVDPANGLRE